jgi:tRNA acetyltransferase TAN1
MESKDRKRSKAKKWFSSKRAKRAFCLAPDQRGFLISCNFREKEAIREAYVLLNEYADRLYGSEIQPAEPASDNDDEDDIDACLEAETEALKAQVIQDLGCLLFR